MVTCCQMRNWNFSNRNIFIQIYSIAEYFYSNFYEYFLFKQMNFNIYRNIPFRFDFKLGGFIRVTRRARTEKKQVKIAAKAAIWVLTFLLYAASFRYVMSCCARQIQIQTKIMRKIILSLGFVLITW